MVSACVLAHREPEDQLPAILRCHGSHRRTLELIAEGKVTGLRIDHIDGLYDPIGHMRKLQLRVGENLYIVLEKILEHGEELPRDFPVSGTTGYDFLDSVNA